LGLNVTNMNQITLLLQSCQQGHADAPNQLLAEVYAELRRVAAAKMARELPGQTLQATALVHEAWLRLGDASFQNRSHFFGAAAEAMRRILIDRARKRQAVRHGAGKEHVELEDGLQIAAPAVQDDELLAVHDALDKLAVEDARKAELVKLHYFVGLTFAEAAEVLGVSEPTAKRDWAFARAWLHREISAAR
jgi:RNA polymerase sigma factor (TIGR02999 family)